MVADFVAEQNFRSGAALAYCHHAAAGVRDIAGLRNEKTPSPDDKAPLPLSLSHQARGVGSLYIGWGRG